jgi:hypothetical protein
LSSLISLNPNHILQPLVLLILETRPTYETKGAFGRASTGSAPHTKPGALPNGLQKRLRSRSSSGSPTLEHYGRGGAAKTRSPAAPTALPRLLPALPPVGSIGARRLQGREKMGTAVSRAQQEGGWRRWPPAIVGRRCCGG